MISIARRRGAAVTACLAIACLIAVTTAAAVRARGVSQPQRRQVAVATLTSFRVVLMAVRGGPGHKLLATVTAAGYRRSGGHWTLIAVKRVGKVNGWFWFAVQPCSLATTQLRNNARPSPPVVAFDSMKVSLLITPSIGCSGSYSERWKP